MLLYWYTVIATSYNDKKEENKVQIEVRYGPKISHGVLQCEHGGTHNNIFNQKVT